MSLRQLGLVALAALTSCNPFVSVDPCEEIAEFWFDTPQAQALVGDRIQLIYRFSRTEEYCGLNYNRPTWTLLEAPENSEFRVGNKPHKSMYLQMDVEGTYRLRAILGGVSAEVTRTAIAVGPLETPPQTELIHARCVDATTLGGHLLCLAFNSNVEVYSGESERLAARSTEQIWDGQQMSKYGGRFVTASLGCDGSRANNGGLHIYDFAAAPLPVLLGFIERTGTTAGVADDDRAYLVRRPGILEAFDVDFLPNIRSLGCGELPDTSPWGSALIHDDDVLVGTPHGLYTFAREDLEKGCDPPAQAKQITAYDVSIRWGGPSQTTLHRVGQVLYVVSGFMVRVFELGDETHLIATFATEWQSASVVLGDTLYLLQQDRLLGFSSGPAGQVQPRYVKRGRLWGHTTISTDGQRLLITAP